ncbi:UDP-glycosyltransferase UGT5-like [Phlebotomus argentipes]|uniref:UDP-glycosyltransferase UGT5-like n=1 Tax=Phlebotomus argentipes TaxID=94469 RepID=UPI0028931EC7|nr:UDP-glycosyltransferase UGT5-like [Phlebotomus argentipes]
MKFLTSLVCLGVVLIAQNASGYNILGVFPTPGRSHYILGSSLMKGLAQAGHNVTIVAAYKQEIPVENMREIVVAMTPADSLSEILYQLTNKSPSEQIRDVLAYGLLFTDETLSDPNVKDLMSSGESFDLVIIEIFYSESLLGFGRIFNAPVIGFSTFGAAKSSTDLNGSPSPLSYVPHFQFTFSDRMSFMQRLRNVLLTTYENVYMDMYYDDKQTALYNKHFPDPKPDLKDIWKTKMPLVLLNSHFSLNHPRPYLPSMVEIGGFHIKRKPKPLPKDLQEFLDHSPNGVIYFSMGSTLHGVHFPTEKRNAILRVFSRLPVKVLWKWEDDTLPGKPENVLIRKWFPQDDILAHPNVRFFITHGGLLSTMEATYHGVPVIGIPIFGDQMMNMAKAEAAGYGLTVKFGNFSEESISWAINELLSNDKYSIRAKTISARFRDQPEDPMSRAVYWIEYVARHGGAKHLISGGQELSFIQYHNLDVFALLLAVPLLIFVILKRMFRKLMKKICKRTCKENLTKKLK